MLLKTIWALQFFWLKRQNFFKQSRVFSAAFKFVSKLILRINSRLTVFDKIIPKKNAIVNNKKLASRRKKIFFARRDGKKVFFRTKKAVQRKGGFLFVTDSYLQDRINQPPFLSCGKMFSSRILLHEKCSARRRFRKLGGNFPELLATDSYLQDD